MKKLLCLILICLCASIGYADVEGVSSPTVEGVTTATCEGVTHDTGTCQSAHVQGDDDSSLAVNRYNGQQYYGFLYTPSSTEQICQIDIEFTTDVGTNTGKDYYVEIYPITEDFGNDECTGSGSPYDCCTGLDTGNCDGFTPNTDLVTNGRSAVVDGADVDDTGVESFTFSGNPELTGSTQYAIVIKHVDDGDPATDLGQTDSTNYIRIRHYNENGTVYDGRKNFGTNGIEYGGDADDKGLSSTIYTIQ